MQKQPNIDTLKSNLCEFLNSKIYIFYSIEEKDWTLDIKNKTSRNKSTIKAGQNPENSYNKHNADLGTKITCKFSTKSHIFPPNAQNRFLLFP